jgi:hypothetical protein
LKLLGLVGLAAVVGIGATAFMVGRQAVEPPEGSARSPTPTTSTGGGLVEVHHQPAGFTISYPKDWSRLESADPQVALVASEHGERAPQGGSILTRVVDLPNEVGVDRLREAKQGTDGIVAKNPSVELKAEPTRLDLGGVPGYFYLYTFRDPDTGQRGVHSHYFLFKGARLITIVFQALPDTDFVRLAPTFDQVAASFRVN